jgi:hypothetical protein
LVFGVPKKSGKTGFAARFMLTMIRSVRGTVFVGKLE